MPAASAAPVTTGSQQLSRACTRQKECCPGCARFGQRGPDEETEMNFMSARQCPAVKATRTARWCRLSNAHAPQRIERAPGSTASRSTSPRRNHVVPWASAYAARIARHEGPEAQTDSRAAVQCTSPAHTTSKTVDHILSRDQDISVQVKDLSE